MLSHTHTRPHTQPSHTHTHTHTHHPPHTSLSHHPTRSNRDEINLGRLRGHARVILAAPQEPLSNSELAALNHHVESGGSVWALSGEGGDTKSGANLNAFLQP